MQNLIKVNILAAKETIYYKIESNTVFKFFSRLIGIIQVIKILEKIISRLDKFKLLYIPLLIDFLRLISYMRGYIDRNLDKKNSEINKWYE